MGEIESEIIVQRNSDKARAIGLSTVGHMSIVLNSVISHFHLDYVRGLIKSCG